MTLSCGYDFLLRFARLESSMNKAASKDIRIAAAWTSTCIGSYHTLLLATLVWAMDNRNKQGYGMSLQVYDGIYV